MDKSWQINCSSTWQPSITPSLPSSSHLPQQGSRNQMEMNAGHCFHPFAAQEFSLLDGGVIQEPMVFNALNSSSCKSCKPELANSFLALLSGSSPQLQCDFQQLSNSKSVKAASKLPVHDSSIVVSSAGYVPITPIMSFSQHQSNGMTGNAAELCPVPFRTAATANCGRASVLHDNLQMTSLNVQTSDSAKTVVHHKVGGSEMGMDLRRGWFSSTNPANASHPHTANLQASPKIPSEAKAVISDHSSALKRTHPRVFCLGTSGDLLLSSTGLLGVVCSCHNLHLSLSKFCEHSGLRVVNPGDAVRLESGETVAQWRRLYFHKIGIRVPDDHSGWDWPEEFSATGGLVKCRATMTNMTKKSDIFQPVDSYGGITRSGQYRNNFVSPKNPHTGLSVVEKSTNKVMHTAQQRNAQDGHNLLNSLISTPHSILPALADSQIMEESPMSRGLPMSNSALNKGQQDDGYQSISEYIDYITKGSNLLISNPSLGSLKLLGTDSDGNRCNSSREGFVMDRDSISSNIELRLGQPSQQSHTMACSILSTVGPQPFDTLGDSQKPLCQDHAIHDTINTRLTEDFSQNLWRASSGTPNINGRETESQLNLAHYAIGGSNAVEPTKLLKGDTAKNSLISMFLQHPRTPYEGSIRSQAANNLVNSSECLMPRVLDGESHIGKCGPAYFPWNRNDGTERKLNINGMALHNHIDKGKGVRLVDNCSYVAAKASSTFVNKQMANSSPFTGVIAGHYIPSNSAVQSSYLVQSSPMLPNANNSTAQLGKASCLGNSGHLDHALRSMYSFPGTAGSGVPLPPVSMGFSSATSISRPNLAPALPNKEGIDVSQHLLDENLRFHVLRHIVELSKQDHAIASNEMNPEQRLLSPSTMEMQRKGSIEGPLASEELSKIPYLTIKQDGSEVVKPLQSCSNRGLGGGVEKLADVAGLNNWSNFSTSTQGISLCSKDLDIQCPPSHGSHFYKQPLLRLGDRAKCFHKEPNTYFPGKCTCAVHSMCLANSCISRGETSLGAYKEHTGSVTGKDSQLIASIFDKGHVISEERAIAVGLCENLRRQIPINKDCHTTQWRDVPRKVVGGCNASRNERPAEVLDARGNVEDHLADTAAKGFKGAPQAAESLKEQQMSNVCSGCSAPAVTEVSIEVNNMDSCTGDAGVARYVNDLIVDEGSGIEKCWSSDDVLDSERSIDTLTVAAKTNSTKKGSSSGLPTQSSRGFFDEFKLKNSFRLKKERNQLHTGFNVHDNIHCTQQIERDLKIGKKKKVMKWKKLDTSFPVSGLSSVHYDSPECAGHSEMHSCSSKEMHIPSRSANGTSTIRGMYSSGPSSLKRKRSALSSALALSWKRNLHGLDGHRRDSEDDYQKQSEGDANLVKIPKLSGEKKLKWDCTANMDRQFRRQDMNLVETEKAAQYTSVGCMKSLSNNRVNTCGKKARPIVCGNSGIISNGKLAEGVAKPPKVVSLSMILKTAKRCTLTENELIPTSMSERKKSKLRNKGRYDAVSILKKERENVSLGTVMKNEVEPGISMIKTKKVYFSRNEVCADELSLLKKESDNGRHRKRGVLHRLSGARLKPRFKETRKRSLYELTRKGKKPGSAKFSLTEISKSKLQSKCISRGKLCLKDAEDSQHYTGELCQVNAKKSIKDHMCQAFVLDSDAFCCVCGSSNTDDMNFLLECSHCSIKVHQACYGVSKVPKGHWSCRPCRTSSKNIVCVLCGYEGGAMTRALRSRNIVKSLLKAWKNLSESKSSNSNPLSKTWQDELGVLDASRSGHEADSVPVMRPTNIESFPMTVLEMDLLNQMDVVKTSNVSSSSSQVHNTVTAGVLDPTVKQWVHMVCGLWTPGTRCPNVDTMSAFDVSGALHPKKKAVCSMCDRPGGLCIQCRVGNCSVQFHPWCAHQKGLLQSEVEGVDNDKVGFYGRCMLHATRHRCVSDSRPVDTKMDSPEQKDFTCARTEGYKGRKREGFRHNLHWQSSDNGGCLVPQEQINAWLHINGQKSCTRGLLKPPASDIEYDCRKEYARYKQAKGWKHLVVYKSGIHALGLYTSRFISRGAMVVEYVGEIVGLRVADKREIEYQSGRKLQYKSACYFFRIDKEHIIDATRKGGIARFVNHSCLPNCVAKVISVRNEKKVVFFAERDINPGEEITYDYHFNHEDEGKKIPCFCNSKNCRRYLN